MGRNSFVRSQIQTRLPPNQWNWRESNLDLWIDSTILYAHATESSAEYWPVTIVTGLPIFCLFSSCYSILSSWSQVRTHNHTNSRCPGSKWIPSNFIDLGVTEFGFGSTQMSSSPLANFPCHTLQQTPISISVEIVYLRNKHNIKSRCNINA